MSRFPKADFILSVAAPVQFPADTGAEVAFAGRSNAGKSSAINAISGRKALARTSKTPGQTRLLNYFELEAGHRIVDLPGYGYADIRAEERRKWVPLLNGAWELLQAQPEPRGDLIFPVHEQTLSKYFKQACDPLSVPNLRYHDLRHDGIAKLF